MYIVMNCSASMKILTSVWLSKPLAADDQQHQKSHVPIVPMSNFLTSAVKYYHADTLASLENIFILPECFTNKNLVVFTSQYAVIQSITLVRIKQYTFTHSDILFN